MLLLAPHFPNATVFPVPVGHYDFRQGMHQFPRYMGDPAFQQKQRMDAENNLAENVQLKVAGGIVADPHGPGVLVSFQMIEGVLSQRGMGLMP